MDVYLRSHFRRKYTPTVFHDSSSCFVAACFKTEDEHGRSIVSLGLQDTCFCLWNCRLRKSKCGVSLRPRQSFAAQESSECGVEVSLRSIIFSYPTQWRQLHKRRQIQPIQIPFSFLRYLSASGGFDISCSILDINYCCLNWFRHPCFCYKRSAMSYDLACKV